MYVEVEEEDIAHLAQMVEVKQCPEVAGRGKIFGKRCTQTGR